jgi:hypothetical protein
MPLFFKGLFNAAIMMRLSYHQAIDQLTQAAARSARRLKKIRKNFSKSKSRSRFSRSSSRDRGRAAIDRSAPRMIDRGVEQAGARSECTARSPAARQVRLASHRAPGHNF